MILPIRVTIRTEDTPVRITSDLGFREVIVTWDVNGQCVAGHADRWDLAMLPEWTQA